jgi:excisionase family DNA binding protein
LLSNVNFVYDLVSDGSTIPRWGMKKYNRKNTDPADGLLTVSEVAGILNVHPNTVRQWSDSGLLKAYRLGTRRDRRFHREEIERFINSNRY